MIGQAIVAALIVGLLSLFGTSIMAWVTAHKIGELHVTFNSKMDRLLDEVSKRAFAEGHQAGGDEARRTAEIHAEKVELHVEQMRQVNNLMASEPESKPVTVEMKLVPVKKEGEK